MIVINGKVVACYIALARHLQTVCITEDWRLLKAFPALTRTMQAHGTV